MDEVMGVPAGGSPAPSRRPLGLTIIAVLWAIGGVLNIYFPIFTVGSDISALSVLSSLPPDSWFRFGVPAELVLSTLLLVLGILQIGTVVGILARQRWSYRMALALPILILAVSAAIAALYFSAPLSLDLRSAIDYPILVSQVAWAVIYWTYLRRQPVRDYLGVKPQGTTTPPA